MTVLIGKSAVKIAYEQEFLSLIESLIHSELIVFVNEGFLRLRVFYHFVVVEVNCSLNSFEVSVIQWHRVAILLDGSSEMRVLYFGC